MLIKYYNKNVNILQIQKIYTRMSSQPDTSMSMNSLMQAIYGEHHPTQYTVEHQDHYNEQLLEFMQSLINHLVELCVTQGFVDNVHRTLNPWLREVKIHCKNPKSSIQGFLRDFLRLFHQQTQKMNKYGQKKLKYLTQTVSKQIFTEIMRMSCDLKLESVNRTNHLRTSHRKINNTNMLVHGIDRLFAKDKMHCFRMLKRSFLDGIQKEEKFVDKIAGAIGRLDFLMVRARRRRLWKGMALWRIRNIEMSQQESVSVFTQAKQFFLSVLPAIVKTWQDKPFNWVNIIIQNLSILVKDAIGNSQGTQIEFLPNPNLHHNSLDYSALSSQRSSISQMSSISIQTYLQNQQIKYDTNNKILIMPIITEHEQIGIIKISWQYQLSITLFNRILGLVEQIKNIIQKFAKITTRLCYYQAEHQNGFWHENLWELCFRDDILQFKSLQQILSLASIAYLEIYHQKSLNSSCIKFGKKHTNNLPDNIFRLIWQKLETVQYFKLDRQSINYWVLKLDNGFCRYSFEEEANQLVRENEQLKNMIIQCIIPLLTKNLGKIGCKKCNIKVKQLHPTLDSLLEKQQKQNHIIQYDYKLMMQIKDTQHAGEAQSYLYELVRKIYEGTYVYAKLFYLVSEKNNVYVYRSKVGEECQMAAVEMPKGLVNGNVAIVEPSQSNRMFKNLRNIMHLYPLFNQAEIYQYQNEKKKNFKIFPQKIGRKALFLLATYQKIPEEQIQQVIQNCSSQIQKNRNLFVKEDLYSWASKITQENDKNDMFVDENQNYLSSNTYLQKQDLMSQVTKICHSLTDVKLFSMWRIKQNHAIEISDKNNEKIVIRNIPGSFLKSQSIKSHQSVKGAHRILRASKNYGQKLQQHLTYIPNFRTNEQKVKYTQAISQSMEQVGQYGQTTDHCYNQIMQFLIRAGKIDKKQCQFISVPINFRNINYALIILYDREVYVSEERFRAITHYLQRNITKLLQRKYLNMKNSALLWFKNCKLQQNILLQNKRQKIKQAVLKFDESKRYYAHRNRTLLSRINKITETTQYMMIKTGFNRINTLARRVQNIYIRSSQYLVNKIQQVYFMNPLISNLIKIRDRRLGVNRLCVALVKMMNNSAVSSRITGRNFMNTLIELKDTKIKAASLKKIVSTKAILQFSLKIYRRNLLQYFSKTHENFISLQRSLKILKQEFILVCPKTVKTSIQFLAGRLNLMLNQHYLMPIHVKLVNCTYPQVENQVMESSTYILVRESSFAFEIKGQHGLVSNLGKLVQPILHEILPTWQIDHRKHQNSRLRILLQNVENIRLKNVKYLFSILHAEHNKNSIQQHTKMLQKTTQQVQLMRQLQKNCNPSSNILKRQKHKKQMDDLKHEISVIQNQLDKISVEARIKSKTNSAYRMLHILNKENKNQNKPSWNQKIKDVEQSRREDVFRHICQVLPLWHTSLNRVIKKNLRAKAEYFFNRINIYA